MTFNQVAARKYHEWIEPPLPPPPIPDPAYQGDGIPIPPRGAALNDPPPFLDAYYHCVEVVDDAASRRFKDVAGERYRNILIEMVEFVTPVLCARVLPLPAPLDGSPTPTPSQYHEFDLTAGPTASADEIWLFPVSPIDWTPAASDSEQGPPPVTFSMPGWEWSQVPATAYPDPVLNNDPQGNPRYYDGIKLARTTGSPITPADLAH